MSRSEGAKNLAAYRASITKEKQLELSAKGGRNGHITKERRKTMKEYLELLLLTHTESGDYLTDMTLAIIQRALVGDTKAYEVIRDTLGEKPKDKVELSAKDEINITIDGKDKS